MAKKNFQLPDFPRSNKYEIPLSDLRNWTATTQPSIEDECIEYIEFNIGENHAIATIEEAEKIYQALGERILFAKNKMNKMKENKNGKGRSDAG